MSDVEKTTEEKLAEMQAKYEKLENDFKKLKSKKTKKIEEPQPIEVPHEEVEVPHDEPNKTTALMKREPSEEVNAIEIVQNLVDDAGASLKNAIVPFVEFTKNKPGTALAVIGGSTAVGLTIANALGYTDFSPITLGKNLLNEITQLGTKKKLLNKNEAPTQIEELGVTQPMGPSNLTESEMREILMSEERYGPLYDGDISFVPFEDGDKIDRRMFTRTKISQTYIDAENRRIKVQVGWRTYPKARRAE